MSEQSPWNTAGSLLGGTQAASDVNVSREFCWKFDSWMRFNAFFLWKKTKMKGEREHNWLVTERNNIQFIKCRVRYGLRQGPFFLVVISQSSRLFKHIRFFFFKAFRFDPGSELTGDWLLWLTHLRAECCDELWPPRVEFKSDSSTGSVVS